MSISAMRSSEQPYPPARYAWLVIAILWMVTLFSQLDRQLPALLVKPLKAQFAISDTQFSLLHGYAFAIAYTLMGLPFGRMVDRINRRNLILFGVVLWSAMTLLSGFARSYEQLLLTRMGIGVGEAVLAPAAYSIIADYVAPKRRGRALSIYYVSLAIGSGASLFMGGLILRLIPAQGLLIQGHTLLPWQATFILAGLPGIPLVFLLLAVREPARRETGAQPNSTLKAFFTHLFLHRCTFARLMTYPALLAVIGYGTLAWAPAFFERQHGIPVSESGPILGLVIAFAGLCGTLLSGQLSDRWLMQGRPAARFRVTLVAWAFIIPAALSWPLVPDPNLSFLLLGFAVFGFSIGQAAAPASIQDIVPNSMRGQAVAVYLLLGGLLGIGLGPTSVALVNDYLYAGEPHALPYALVTVTLPAAVLGLWMSWSGLACYARTCASLKTLQGQP
ncbi:MULTISPECIES: spinster family MFS transporter [unclassified Pseudomonas]|uniref:spinster family MFS transporter n=1 Tax=unclassified Pseudomonas TaxID=196821 RepID=UPI0025E94E2C|nr:MULTISPECIES: MFS transporter [unclassified Pseudomonas]